MQPQYEFIEDGYRLTAPHQEDVGILWECEMSQIRLTDEGILYLASGYEWNGSNVVADHPRTIRGALGHDPLYDLIAAGELPRRFRKPADAWYRRTIIADGYRKWKAWVRYWVLRARWSWKDRSF